MLKFDVHRHVLSGILVTAGLVFAQSALAADYCVKPNTTCGGTVVGDLQTALNNAAVASDPDRIFLGSAVYKPPVSTGFDYYRPDGPVEIIGAGQSYSRVQGQDGGSNYVLRLFGGPGSSLHDLDIGMPANAAPGITGLFTNALAKHIGVRDNGLANMNPRWGVALSDGTLEDSVVQMDLDGQTGGVSFQSPGSTIRDSGVNARIGLGSFFGGTVERSAIGGGMTAVTATRNTTRISSSVIYTYSASAHAISASTSSGYTTVVVADGVIISGDETTPGSFGVQASTSYAPAESASVTLKNSIIRNVGTALEATTSGTGTASIAASYSDYGAPNHAAGPNASIAEDHISNVGMAGFDPDHGWQPLAGSPLIDAGDPAEAQGLDYDGQPLVTDGDHDGTARRDIGAFELPGPLPGEGIVPPATEQAPPPADAPPSPPAAAARDTQAPIVSAFKTVHRSFAIGRARTALSARVFHGTVFRYRLSEAAKVVVEIRRAHGRVAGTLTRTGKAGANSIRFTGRLGRRALRPGVYRARITATDGAGNRSAARVTRFSIVAPG